MYLSFLYYGLILEGYSLLTSDSFNNTVRISDFSIYYSGISLQKHCLYLIDCDTNTLCSIPSDTTVIFCHVKEKVSQTNSALFVTSNEPTAQLINSISNIYKRFDTMVTRFHDRTASLDFIMQDIYRAFLVPCVLIDSSFEPLSTAGSFSSYKLLNDPGEKESLNQQMIWDRSFYDTQTLPHAFIYENHALTDETTYMLCYNIFVNTHFHSRFALLFKDEWKASLLQSIVDDLGQEFKLYFKALEARNRYSYHSEDFHSVMQAIIAGNSASDLSVLHKTGWLIQQQYQVYLFHFDARFPMQVGNEYLRNQLIQFLGECFVSEYHNAVVCICNLGSAEPPKWKNQQKLIAFLGEYIGHAGISNIYTNLLQTPQYIREAEIALQLGEEKDPTLWYYFFSNYSYDYILRHACSEFSAEELVPPALLLLKKRDSEKGSELLTTLETYIHLKCNGNATADALFIHRTTFQYRMKKIEELTGLHIQDTLTFQKLLLGFEILRSKKE